MEEERITSGYFHSINQHLSRYFHSINQQQIASIRSDVKTLILFCRLLETWDYSSIIDDERFMSFYVITSHLKLIWPKDLPLILQQYLISHGTEEAERLVSVLEGMIVQSKQLVDRWFSIQIHSSSSMMMMMMMQYNSLFFPQMPDFVHKIRERLRRILSNVRDYKYDSVSKGIVVLQSKMSKEIDVLESKMEFLERALKQVNMGCPDGEEKLGFMNFAGYYANNVASLTCLYWANEDYNNQIASEMSFVLFDMLHKFIPYAYDVSSFLLYNITLNSIDVHLESDFFRIGDVVEWLVGFFFDHLAMVLRDDFLLLRDRLMFLFTFLADPPRENAEEGDVIRIDIYAILHKDEYLLSNFKEMNKDLSDQKVLFSAFMNRIETVNDKIMQLHRGGSSDSWITLELEKMVYNYFLLPHIEISYLLWADMFYSLTHDNREKMQLCKMELRFLRMSFLWLATWDDTDEEIKLNLSSVITSFQGTWGQEEEMGLLHHRFYAARLNVRNELNLVLHELKERIGQSMLETKTWHLCLFHLRFRYKASTSYKILKFMDSILDNLNDLVSYRASKIIPFVKQIETLEGKLILLKNLLKLAVNCKHCQELGEFKIFVQAFAHDAARLSFLYWTKQGANAISTADETNSMLSQLLQKIKPTTPNVARLYFGILTSITTHRSDSHIFGQTAFSFVKLFLEDLVTHLEAEDFQILQDNIVFLLTFLNDPPNQNGVELICSQIDVLFWNDLYSLTPFDDGNEGGFSQKKAFLSDFMMNIEAINADIMRRIYGTFPDSSLYNFPKVIPPQFLDFLLKKLKSLKDRMNSDRKYVPFVKYKILKIEEQLASLCPFFVRIFDFQNETWLEVVNVLYLTEYVIMSSISSLFVFDHPFWYHIAYLSKVFDEIQAVKAKMETIKLENNAIYLPSSVGFVGEVVEQSDPSKINEIVVGFEDEKKKLIDMLTSGSKSLEIVSIVGMGGLGKTTLAQNIFGSSSVRSHFSVLAFCSVSSAHNVRKMLLDIISAINGVDDRRRDKTDADLAQELRQSLIRRRYLVVLDDIWDKSAWNEVKRSFPNDNEGSRVLFTSRSFEVVDQCGINCITHQLRLMSEIESWELFQKKVFRNDISPPLEGLHGIGNKIVKNCNGLPLAIVVIGGLLARTEKSLKWWSEVEQGLSYYLSKEGCMDILELSYKHLPENLKPCFVYLGAFPEDRLISVKRVIRLWIAEGFVQEENVAAQYFQDLVVRSLIIVGKRSSSGGIKSFRVHDLVRELCVMKCRDGNFVKLNHGIASSGTSSHSIENTYRFSMQREGDIIAAGSSLCNARTLCYYKTRYDGKVRLTHLRKFRLLQVLDCELDLEDDIINQLNSLIHLRHIYVVINRCQIYNPLLITNLGLITNLELRHFRIDEIILPDTFWRMKSLRRVKLGSCFLTFPDEEEEHEDISDDQILDKVVSFSKPVLYTQKDVKRLHQKLPALQKLSCYIEDDDDDDDGPTVVEKAPFDFGWELRSLTVELRRNRRTVDSIKLSSTLKQLTLYHFSLQKGTGLSAIATNLHVLEVLKLNWVDILESKKLETGDLAFENLKFFEMSSDSLEEWNASTESFPCLEQLVIHCKHLKELPPCFGEIPTLYRIVGSLSSEAESSALRIKEELKELGTQLEYSIRTYKS